MSQSHTNHVRLISVANYESHKGIKALIELMRHLKRRELNDLPKFTLTLVGDPDSNPDYTKELVRDIERYEVSGVVDLVGRKDRSRVLELYLNSDIFVFASRGEGFGMVVAEAMKTGLPVVAMDLPVLRELVVNGKNGYLVPQGRLDQMARVVSKLATNEALRESMGRAGREMSRRVAPAWEHVCEEFYRQLRSMLG